MTRWRPSRRASSALHHLGSGPAAPPEGIPPALWKRLCLHGSWSSVAGHPMGRLTRPLDLDRSGVLDVVASSESWARELESHADAIVRALRSRSGQRVARLRVRVDPERIAEMERASGWQDRPPLAQRGHTPDAGDPGLSPAVAGPGVRPFAEGLAGGEAGARGLRGDRLTGEAEARALLHERLEDLRERYLRVSRGAGRDAGGES